MRKRGHLFFIPVFVFVVYGCAENQTRVGEGAAIGGVLGAGVGEIIGHQSHHDMAGVLLGGAIGAASGAVVGSQIPKPPAQNVPQQATSPSSVPAAQPTVQQVVDLSQEGASTDDIIARIRAANNPRYYLTADDIDDMHKKGVSQRVIDVMQSYK